MSYLNKTVWRNVKNIMVCLFLCYIYMLKPHNFICKMNFISTYSCTDSCVGFSAVLCVFWSQRDGDDASVLLAEAFTAEDRRSLDLVYPRDAGKSIRYVRLDFEPDKPVHPADILTWERLLMRHVLSLLHRGSAFFLI